MARITLASLIAILLAGACAAQFSQPPYSVTSAADTYPTIAGATVVALGDDELSAVIAPSGFSFNLFSSNYTQFRIGSNGYILAGSAGTTTSAVPAHTTDGNAISPFWGDLVPASGQISYLVVGSKLYVEWANVAVRVGNDTTSYGVRVMLEVNGVSGAIHFYYETPNSGGFAGSPTSVAQSVAISQAPTATQHQKMPGKDTGYVATNGAVTTYPAGRRISYNRIPNPIAPINITTASTLPHGEDSQPYFVQLHANGGVKPYAGWSAGGIPTNWQVTVGGTSNQGAVEATNGSDVNGGAYLFFVDVWDSLQGYDLKTFIAPVNPAHATEGQAYSFQMGAKGGLAPHTWTGVSVPSWLSVSPDGLITSNTVAPSPGTYTLTLTVSDSFSNPWTFTTDYELVVEPGALTITTQTLPDGQVGVPYTATISAMGGSGSGYQWSITSGSLPPGITGIPGSGTSNADLTGTPGAVGTYTFDVTVTDDAANTYTMQFTIDMDIVDMGGGSGSGGAGCVANGNAGWLLLCLPLLLALRKRRRA